MTITINGTTGIAGVDGSASTPAVQGADTNTGIFFPAADTIAFAEGGVESMRIDSSGNVGIGTTSPTSGSVLDVASSGNTYPRIRSTAGSSAAVFFQNSDTGTTTGDGMYVGITGAEEGVIWNTENTAIRVATNNAERARIDSSGVLCVGTTGLGNNGTAISASGSGRVVRIFGTTESEGALVVDKSSATTTTSQVYIQFSVNGQATACGQINANGASTAAFGSFSDRRLKENITELPSQLANIMALRPVEFDYVESMGGGHQIGFIAQEVQEIYPDLVGVGADEMLTLTDMNKNDARLIKCIQELKAELDTVKAQNAAFEARLAALEAK